MDPLRETRVEADPQNSAAADVAQQTVTPAAELAPVQAPTIQTAAQPAVPDVPSPAEVNQMQQTEEFSYADDQESPYQEDSRMISWTAKEFVANNKPDSWYAVLAGGTVILGVVIWFLTRDTFAAAAVVVIIGLVGVYSRRQPQETQYVIEANGLTIGRRHYPYSAFRSFSVGSEGELSNIELMPMKRFAMFTALYFPPEDEEKIVAALSNFLPIEERRNDVAENVMRRLRF